MRLLLLSFDHFHALAKDLLDRLLPNYSHNEVEVFLRSLVSQIVQQYLRTYVDALRLSAEKPLYLLQHLQDLEWRHAPIVIVVT